MWTQAFFAIVIWTNKNEHDYDSTLLSVVKRARDKGVKFNSDKIQFKVSTVSYMENLVSADGLNRMTAKLLPLWICLHLTMYFLYSFIRHVTIVITVYSKRIQHHRSLSIASVEKR